MGSVDLVCISDPNGLAEFYQQDNVTVPQGVSMPPWQRWREDNNRPKGIMSLWVYHNVFIFMYLQYLHQYIVLHSICFFLRNTMDWKRMRSVLNKQIGRPSSAAKYVSQLSDVASDMISHLKRVKSESQPDGIMMRQELFKWAFECE